MAMPYIDFAQSEAIDAELFQNRRPFPWISVEHFLTGGGYGLLRRSLPEVALCAQEFDRKRGHHQASHDGYAWQYRPGLPIVVINRMNWQVRWRRLRGKDADGYPLTG
ncbi:hypothetical protein [Acidithiobacillus sulfuriphilus]|uniref:Uncharacterized protein n=2 Tax=Acidithiobacillus sulfuriphilus TaxID=1867749 RepID=A0A3M8RK10_9PROT|nr:hypothetical protein [Acidithiobacillus sulfuriphilus]RNF68695.1 hypothetical protein EC580_02735 [Acidithiobacillus sulfuriphilus]